MGKHRIYEIAKELGKSNQEVIDVLAKNNIQVKSLSTVDDAAKEMVVRAFAKKPVQPEKKPAPQQQKAQNNAPKAVPAKNDANKASSQKQVKVQVQNQPKPVEKNKPQQDNRPKNAGNKPAPAHNEQRNQNQVKNNNNQNNQNHKKNNQPMQQHASRAKTISRTVLSARREVFLSDRKDSSPGRVPSRTAVPQDSSKAVLKTRTAAASRAANSSLTKNAMKNRRLKASMQAATAAICTAATI